MAAKKKIPDHEVINDEVVEGVEVEITEPTAQELSEMDRLRTEAEDSKNFALRTKADLENMKKRNQNIAAEMYALGKTDVIKKILPIADSFDRAALAITDVSRMDEGFMMIKKQLEDVLDKLGVKEISAIGHELNTDLHNALMQVDDAENCGKIVQVYEKGYTLDDKVIRHSSVVVAK